MSKRILISLAHPDDETFGLGGLILKYVDEGAEVYLICATNGDVGTVPEEMLANYASISDLRLAELANASEILGFKEVFTLNYKDSGMMGSDFNEDPDCLWYQYQHHPEQIEKRLVDIIRQVRPQVLITFDAFGGYGHPDHIAIHQASLKAFELAADPAYVSDAEPYQIQKVYYPSLPAFLLKSAILFLKLRRKDPTKLGTNQDLDLKAVVKNLQPVHTRVSVKDYLESWDRANACHASQGGGANRFVPLWFRRNFAAKQSLTRFYPPPVQNRVDESDLFDGVNLKE